MIYQPVTAQEGVYRWLSISSDRSGALRIGFVGECVDHLRQSIGHLRPMSTSVDPSLFLLLNIDSGDERRRPRNTLESSLTPGPCHFAFAFTFVSNTSDLYIRGVLVFMGPDYTDTCLRSLLILANMEDRLTIHFAFMDLWWRRALWKMLHEEEPGNRASKDFVTIAQIIDDTFSRPTHGCMACFDGFCLSSTEDPHTHDKERDYRDNKSSELHDYSLHNLYSAVVKKLADSITHGKSPTDLLRILHLVDHRHRIVLDRDAAFSLGIYKQLVRSKAEFPGPLARRKVR